MPVTVYKLDNEVIIHATFSGEIVVGGSAGDVSQIGSDYGHVTRDFSLYF